MSGNPSGKQVVCNTRLVFSILKRSRAGSDFYLRLRKCKTHAKRGFGRVCCCGNVQDVPGRNRGKAHRQALREDEAVLLQWNRGCLIPPRAEFHELAHG